MISTARFEFLAVYFFLCSRCMILENPFDWSYGSHGKIHQHLWKPLSSMAMYSHPLSFVHGLVRSALYDTDDIIILAVQ